MKLGRFRLVAELARGGMAVVWLAEARGPAGFARSFVLKELLPELATDHEHRAMFLDEARLAGRLVHKNIVQTFDVARDRERLFMVLELLEGCSLAHARKLVAPARLPVGLAVDIVREILSGLHHAHELRDDEGRPLRVVHRDVSANNVFLTTNGEVKLLDFGLARSSGRARRTEHGFVKGSIAYLSPDHVAEAAIDRRADVFAAGVLLRELLVGERLWAGVDDGAIVRRLVGRDIPAFPEGTSVPPALRRICEKAMAPYRAQRFATAAEMRAALDAWARTRDDRAGSLADLAGLFDGPLASERERARCLLRAHRAMPPPLPVTLPSDALEPVVPPLRPARREAGPRVAIAALVALLLAATTAATGIGDDDARAAAETSQTDEGTRAD